MKDIYVDPITRGELNEVLSAAFEQFVDAVEDQDLEEMDSQEIAELFFVNGFISGCLAMQRDENVRETIHVLTEEVRYQHGEDCL